MVYAARREPRLWRRSTEFDSFLRLGYTKAVYKNSSGSLRASWVSVSRALFGSPFFTGKTVLAQLVERLNGIAA